MYNYIFVVYLYICAIKLFRNTLSISSLHICSNIYIYLYVYIIHRFIGIKV